MSRCFKERFKIIKSIGSDKYATNSKMLAPILWADWLKLIFNCPTLETRVHIKIYQNQFTFESSGGRLGEGVGGVKLLSKNTNPSLYPSPLFLLNSSWKLYKAGLSLFHLFSLSHETRP